jgi:hypothetical protein
VERASLVANYDTEHTKCKPTITFVKQTHFGSHDTIIGDAGHLQDLTYSITDATGVLLLDADSCKGHVMTLMVFPSTMKHVCLSVCLLLVYDKCDKRLKLVNAQFVF